MSEREYTWFVRPLDKHSSHRFCEHFDIEPDSEQCSKRVKIQVPVRLSDGKQIRANLIEVTEDQKNIALELGEIAQVQFQLFVQEGKGQIRFCPKKYARGKPVFAHEHEGVSYDYGT